MAIAISSWNSSLHAYGMWTCTEQVITKDRLHPGFHYNENIGNYLGSPMLSGSSVTQCRLTAIEWNLCAILRSLPTSSSLCTGLATCKCGM